MIPRNESDEWPKPAPSAEPDPEEEEGDLGPYFCVCCDVANVTKCDEDRCCVECGFDLVPLSQIQALLSRADLAIVKASDVPSAEERVWRQDCEINARRAEALEALLREAVDDTQGLPSWRERAQAELARRAAKAELPHGIPEGENDKGWPEGTPESVTKGGRNV